MLRVQAMSRLSRKIALYSGPPKSMAACCRLLPPDAAGARATGVELEEKILERRGVEGQPEPDTGGLAERRAGHQSLIVPIGLLIE